MVDNTRIEVYRANIANPESLEPLRFWVQNELVKIQSGFVSADEVINEMYVILDELIATGGLQGEKGDTGNTGSTGPSGSDGSDGVDGSDGQDATASDLIDDNRILYDKTWSSRKIAQQILFDLSEQLLGDHYDASFSTLVDGDMVDRDQPNGKWVNGRRTRFIPAGYIQGNSYQRGDEVANGSQISEALIDGAIESPFVAPTGDPKYAFQGTLTEAPVSAKQILFGTRYAVDESGYITGVRVQTTIGNRYEVYFVNNPLGDPDIVLLLSFTATTDGITNVPIGTRTVLAGTTFDAITKVNEPDPTPTVISLNYNYLTPQNIGVPAVGEISHGRGTPDTMRVNKTANNGSLPLLAVGDIIDGAGIQWSVQAVTDSGAYWTFVVAPASTGSAGVQDFGFETVAATPITIGSDLDYWLTGQPLFGTAHGLYGVDISYQDIVPDDTAYGTDVEFQAAYIPTEWQVKMLTEGGGSSSSALTVGELDWVHAQADTTALYSGAVSTVGNTWTEISREAHDPLAVTKGTLVVDARRTDAIGYYTAKLTMLAYTDGALIVEDSLDMSLGVNQLMVRAIADGTDIVIEVRGGVGSMWDWKVVTFSRELAV